MTETLFRSSIREILGRQVSKETLRDMWLSLDAHGGTRVAPRLLRYIDERRQNARRWADALRTYPGPQQFIWGPADPVSGAHVLPRIRELAPEAATVVLEEAPAVGHYPQIEAPELVSPLLVEHLAPEERHHRSGN